MRNIDMYTYKEMPINDQSKYHIHPLNEKGLNHYLSYNGHIANYLKETEPKVIKYLIDLNKVPDYIKKSVEEGSKPSHLEYDFSKINTKSDNIIKPNITEKVNINQNPVVPEKTKKENINKKEDSSNKKESFVLKSKLNKLKIKGNHLSNINKIKNNVYYPSLKQSLSTVNTLKKSSNNINKLPPIKLIPKNFTINKPLNTQKRINTICINNVPSKCRKINKKIKTTIDDELLNIPTLHRNSTLQKILVMRSLNNNKTIISNIPDRYSKFCLGNGSFAFGESGEIHGRNIFGALYSN